MRPPIEATEPDQVRRALTHLLAERGMWDVHFIEKPRPLVGGFDTTLYRFRVDGEELSEAWRGPLVARIYTALDRDEQPGREAAIQCFAADRGFPALRPVLAEASDNPLGFPLMIMPRVGGSTMFKRMMANPWRLDHWLARMASLQVRLHQIPLEGCPIAYERPLIETLLGNVRKRIDAFTLAHLEDSYAWLARHKGAVLDEAPSLCHGDLHPLNILADTDDSLVLIDWSDAKVGDRHYDVAHTLVALRISKIAASGPIQRLFLGWASERMFDRYLACYQELAPLDSDQLQYWMALNAFTNWLLLSELPFDTRAAVPDTVAALPRGLAEELKQLFWQCANRSASSDHPRGA
jgi:aminoglycoside phosphotransferase